MAKAAKTRKRLHPVRRPGYKPPGLGSAMRVLAQGQPGRKGYRVKKAYVRALGTCLLLEDHGVYVVVCKARVSDPNPNAQAAVQSVRNLVNAARRGGVACFYIEGCVQRGLDHGEDGSWNQLRQWVMRNSTTSPQAVRREQRTLLKSAARATA